MRTRQLRVISDYLGGAFIALLLASWPMHSPWLALAAVCIAIADLVLVIVEVRQ